MKTELRILTESPIPIVLEYSDRVRAKKTKEELEELIRSREHTFISVIDNNVEISIIASKVNAIILV